MPESTEEFHARVLAAQSATGRLPLAEDGFTAWEPFPFEGELRVKVVTGLADEQPRMGEDPDECWCASAETDPDDWPVVWRDADWHVKVAPPSGSPVVLCLEPNRHLDLDQLDDDLAAGLGRLTVSLTRAIESLPSVGRCHIGRWGDGGAHAHVWFIARPARMPQLRGSFMALWDDLLPPVPVEVRDANVEAVVDRLLAERGGTR